jgi:acetyltransferase-like isoleucine patch superfamily enzyme
VRRDHRPYFLKKAYLNFQRWHVEHFLRPQLDSLGKGYTFIKPWHVKIFGSPIHIGCCVNVIATSDKKVRLTVWPQKNGEGYIRIGDYSLMSPGVRIESALGVDIGSSCMLASNVYIMDSDWHGVYDRISAGKSRPVSLAENVWVGDSAILCKGIQVGANSIIGAGAVVVSDVPPNSVFAGNPARLIKKLNPHQRYTTRQKWFDDALQLDRDIDQLDKELLQKNTIRHWLRAVFNPRQED